MLLQLELIVWIVSLMIIVIVPFIWLGHFLMKRYQAKSNPQLSDDSVGGETEQIDEESSASEIISDQVHNDPVIAAMNREDHTDGVILSTSQTSDSGVGSAEHGSDNDKSQTLDDTEITPTPNEESNIYDGDAVVLLQDLEPQHIEVTVTDEDTQESVQLIMDDLDGDGTIDEAVIIHNLPPAELSDTKRQRSIEVYAHELRSLKDKGQPSMYEKKLIEARALHPDHREFGMLLAEHYYGHGEFRKSLGLYRGMAESDSHDDKSLWMIANCYIKLSERENAQVILEKLVQEKSENPRYRMSLTEVYYNFSDLGKAIDCVRMMVKLRPTNSDYLSTLAQLYYESEQFDLYVQVLYRMLELDPLNHEIKAEIAKYT